MKVYPNSLFLISFRTASPLNQFNAPHRGKLEIRN